MAEPMLKGRTLKIPPYRILPIHQDVFGPEFPVTCKQESYDWNHRPTIRPYELPILGSRGWTYQVYETFNQPQYDGYQGPLDWETFDRYGDGTSIYQMPYRWGLKNNITDYPKSVLFSAWDTSEMLGQLISDLSDVLKEHKIYLSLLTVPYMNSQMLGVPQSAYSFEWEEDDQMGTYMVEIHGNDGEVEGNPPIVTPTPRGWGHLGWPKNDFTPDTESFTGGDVLAIGGFATGNCVHIKGENPDADEPETDPSAYNLFETVGHNAAGVGGGATATYDWEVGYTDEITGDFHENLWKRLSRNGSVYGVGEIPGYAGHWAQFFNKWADTFHTCCRKFDFKAVIRKDAYLGDSIYQSFASEVEQTSLGVLNSILGGCTSSIMTVDSFPDGSGGMEAALDTIKGWILEFFEID